MEWWDWTFTVQVTDAATRVATQAFTVTIASNVPPIATTSLPNPQPGVAYAQTVNVYGGVPPYNWMVIDGTLPGGLSLDSPTGLISGTASVGAATFTLQVRDSGGQLATQQLMLSIGSSISIPAAELPGGVTGAEYGYQLYATGGTGPYSWTVASGALPPGLRLESWGRITGTPVFTDVATFTVQATDSVGGMATQGLVLGVRQRVGALAAGAVPPSGGFGLIVYTGGTVQQLVTATGCPVSTMALWSVSNGTFVIYVPGTSNSTVNATFLASFPNGELPADTPLIAKCV
ncbi:MAG: Ig domain-containing protein [Chloroflexota bacterium]